MSDGWSRQQRYLAWTNTGEGYIGALTTVNVPSKKANEILSIDLNLSFCSSK